MVSLLLSQNSLSWTRSLKSLILSRATGLRYKGLEMPVRACPFLESVDVSYCCGFGDREAAALSCAGGLRELRMDKCLNVTDVGLAKIAVRCVNLERLSLKWCMEISDLGIDLLCKKCQDLKFLNVSYLKINLSYCALSDMALCMVMGNLSRLQDAKLVHLTNCTREGFVLALQTCCVWI